MSKYIFVKINDDITSIKRLKEMFPKINEEDFKTILGSDPTYNNSTTESGKYGRWLLSLFNKNNLKKEDLYKAKEYLGKFEKLKNKISNKDINFYKTLPDLYKAIEETEAKEPTKSELKRNVQRTDLDKETELFMETENFKIYIPLTYEASCKLGNNTQWCTATRSDRRYYDMYTEDNNELYIFINKSNPSEKYQWNTKERYTCDKNDEKISEFDLCVKHPDLAKFFDKFGYDIGELIEKLKECVNGKAYLYKGEEIDEELIPYLKKVKVSKRVKSIKEGAFRNCKALESIEIPNGVTNIGSSAFYKCSSLANITIPNTVTSIDDSAFVGCSSLKNIELPNSITDIGFFAFEGCSSLTNIKIPDGITKIGKFIFGGCSALKSVELPDGITEIDYGAFKGCISLENIKLPNSLKGIWNEAFVNCRSLKNIEIPDGVIKIRKYAFSECTSLKSVTIPNSVKFISLTAFEGHSPDLVIKTKNPYAIEYCEEYDLKYSEE